jgi:hypothetical protein
VGAAVLEGPVGTQPANSMALGVPAAHHRHDDHCATMWLHCMCHMLANKHLHGWRRCQQLSALPIPPCHKAWHADRQTEGLP